MISLRPYNSFGVKAHCDQLKIIRSTKEIPFGLSKPYFILGGGSNVLFTKDYHGQILKNEIPGRQIIQESLEHVIIKFGAGESWHSVVCWAVNHHYGGIENLSLIPGTVGAAPIQNIGAYGVEIKDVIYAVEGYRLDTGEQVILSAADCKFGYRDSVFKHTLKDHFFITAVSLKLTKKNHQFSVSYDAIRKVLEEKNIKHPTLKLISEVVIAIRQSKLPDPKILGNGGSFFKNPIVTKAKAKTLKTIYKKMPYYPLSDLTKVKLSAAWLIDQCGWKGKKMGRVGVYDKHALVLVHYGQATGAAVWDLALKIKEDVNVRFDISLTPELTIL